MKTTKGSNGYFPSTLTFLIYLFTVAVICFINCTLNAGDPAGDEIRSLEARLAVALIEEPEPVQEIEDWMLTIGDEVLRDIMESEIVLEAWMYEDSLFRQGEKTEPEHDLRDWMVNTSSWRRNEFYAGK